MFDSMLGSMINSPLKTFFVIIFLIYIILFLYIVFSGICDKLILFPSTNSLYTKGLTRQIFTNEEKLKIEIWVNNHFKNKNGDEKAKVLILHFGGNAARAEDDVKFMMEVFGDYPVEIWGMNYQGYGKSEGKANLKSIPKDAQSAYQEILKASEGRPIILSGNSIGTTAALYVASRNKVAGIFLKNPPPLQNLIREEYGNWNLWLLSTPAFLAVPSELNSLTNAPETKTPALIISAQDDEIVPSKFQEKIIKSYAGRKRIVYLPKASHNFFPLPSQNKDLKDGILWLMQEAQK